MPVLLWDFDETLAFRDGRWTRTLTDLLDANHVSAPKLHHLRPLLNVGFPWHSPDTPHSAFFRGLDWWEAMTQNFQDIYVRCGVDVATARALAGQVRSAYLRADHWDLYPDTQAALEIAAAHRWTNVIASNHVPELASLVEKLGIINHFAAVYTSGLIGHEKPSREFFQHILNDLGVTPNDCHMIGDSYRSDVAGAIRCGIEATLVRTKNHKDYYAYAPDAISAVRGLLGELDPA